MYFSLRGKEYALGDEDGDLPDELDDDADGEGERGPGRRPGQGGGGGGDAISPEELAEMLYQALLRGRRRA